MSPDANLEEQRELARRILNDDPITGLDIRRLAMLVQMLDAAIHDTGVLPEEWAVAVAKAEGKS